MISLILNKVRTFKEGDLIHLKVRNVYEQTPGKWRLEADDVTPLPGAEPDGYCCAICGIIVEAKPDGSLPEGWTVRSSEKGDSIAPNYFVCIECSTLRDK